MKKVAIALLMVIIPSFALAATFAPTPLTITAPAEFEYAFQGSNLSMPITIGGTNAQYVFAVYTSDKGAVIGNVRNGYLGWHTVNKIDTCLYVSPKTDASTGSATVTWDGKDTYGTVLPADTYNYYIWAFDNITPRIRATTSTVNIDRNHIMPIEYDLNGAPLAQPKLWWMNNYTPVAGKWTLGNDTESDSHMETCDLEYYYGGPTTGLFNPRIQMPWAPDRNVEDIFYRGMVDWTAKVRGLYKEQWVPNGTHVKFDDWGTSLRWNPVPFNRAGSTMAIAGQDLIYTNGWASSQPVPGCYAWICDYDGNMLYQFVNEWYAYQDLYDAGITTDASHGPDFATLDGTGRLYMGNWSCQNVCFNPLAYMTEFGGTETYHDMDLWANTNGDFYYDANWQGESPTWLCGGVDPASRSIYADKNGFVSRGNSGIGGISGIIFGPDGTGIVKYTWADEVSVTDPNNEAQGVFFVNNGSAYDGAYTDYSDAGYAYIGTFYDAYDSVTGKIKAEPGLAVDDAAPAAFAVAQNSPNPFNPTTTINYTISESGNVTVDIFNVAGQKVASLVNGQMGAGSHSAVWNAANCSAGVYFYTVKAGNHTKTMKMTLLK